MRAHILSIGITAPGITSFEAFKIMMLADAQPNTSEELEKYSPSFLPANERRRTTATIKLALSVAEEALEAYKASYPEADLQVPVLFVSRDGDSMISAKMCQAVSEEEPMISPTQFHNSVHNAPAGYWMIGQGNQAPASAISVGRYAIANGLLEAVLQSKSAQKPVLVVFYDLPVDPTIPIRDGQDSSLPFAFSMMIDSSEPISQSATDSNYPVLNLSLTLINKESPVVEDNPYLGSAAAEAYPLLKSIALFETSKEKKNIIFKLNEHNFVQVSLS